MGVVRREGDWRLEKQGEGVYEITFDGKAQLKILTSGTSRRKGEGEFFEPVPVREVSSYTEVKGLFEEKAHGPPHLGMNTALTETSGDIGTQNLSVGGGDLEIDELPPFGIGFAFVLAGGLVLYTFWNVGDSLLLLFGIAFLGAGVLPFAYAGYLFKTEGVRTAWDFLVSVDESEQGSTTSPDGTGKTPPPSEKQKNTIIFDRAEQRCEWCEERFDHLQVHHLKPRREGGPNEPQNLVALCPNCHENADREAIPRSKLKAKVRRLPSVSAE